MAKSDVWSMTHTERAARSADDLEGISAAQWDTHSLCEGWTVRDVVAHMTASAKVTPASFFGTLISSGFSFNRLTVEASRRNEVTRRPMRWPGSERR